MVKLIYPTVDVFIYDLRKTLLDTDTQIKARYEIFLRKVYQNEILKQKIAASTHLKDDNADYIELIKETFERDLDGYYYALQFSDGYSLQVNYSGEKKAETNQNQPVALEKIPNYKKVIVEHINKTKVLSDTESEISKDKKGTIGETWLLWGKLESSQDSELEIAQKCYQQLAPQIFHQKIPSILEKRELNKLQGGYIFEFWQHPSLEQDYHLLVWLFPQDLELNQIKDRVESTYYDLTRLLFFRHKINLAYKESQYLKKQIKEKYTLINHENNLLEQDIKTGKYNLNKLRTNLATNLKHSSEYTKLLADLKFQNTTIEVNLNNYQKRLKKIQAQDTNNKLQNLNDFIDYARKKYQQDIEATYGYFSSGIILLEQTIKTIEGIINIEQTQGDRNLNELVAVVSAGLGAGAITASLISAQPPIEKTAIEFYGTNIKITLIVIVIGGLIGYFLWKIYLFITGFWRKKIVSNPKNKY